MSRLVSGVLALLLLAGGLVLVASGEQSSAVTGNIEWVEMSAGAGDLPVPLGGSEQTALLVGDIDGDGDDDIAMGSRGGTNSVVWFRRTGSTWEQSVVDAVALRPEAGGALHDVDGDGLLDIVLAGDFMSNEIWWWKNPGATAFGSAWTRYTAKNSGANKHHDIAFGDFDNDGSDEFAYWNQGNGNTVNDLFIAEIPADPTTSSSWPAQVVVDATTFSEGLAVGDVDADGDDDLVGGGRIISYNSTTSSYDVTTVNLAEASYRWHIADIVQGGRPELITASGDNPGGLGYYEWDGATWVYTTLLTHELAGTWSEGHSVDTGDVDGDGFIDVFAAEMAINAGAAARSVVFYGDGAGSFVRDLVSTGIDNHESKLADIDDDGDLDIVSKPFNQGTPELRLFANPFPGHDVGSWQRHLVGTNTLKQAWVRHGDIDLDGDLDLLAGRAWFENPGSLGGSWTRHVLPSPMLHAFLLVDVDGDGDLDVFGEQGLNSMTYVWSENDGSGSFTSRSNIQNIVTATNEFHQGVTFVETPTGVEIYTLWNDRALGIEKITVPADPINTTWPTVLTSLPSQGEEAAFVDIDGDGDLDFIQGHMWSLAKPMALTPTSCCTIRRPAASPGSRCWEIVCPTEWFRPTSTSTDASTSSCLTSTTRRTRSSGTSSPSTQPPNGQST